MSKQDNFTKFTEDYNIAIYRELIMINDKIEFRESGIEAASKEYDLELLESDEGLKYFYENIDFWFLKWKAKPEYNIEGSLNILSYEKLLIGDVDFEPEKNKRMKGFTLLDHFYNEAAVGLYLDQPERGLFYFEFDGDPKPLHLDFDGYLKMLKYTRAFSYWQLSIVTLANGNPLTMTDKYKNVMKLFPDFNIEELTGLYESLRIDK